MSRPLRVVVVVGVMRIAALALRPRMVDRCAPAARQPAVPSRRRVVALAAAAAALLAPGVLVVQELTGGGRDVLPLAIASALMLLLVCRRSTGLIGELERRATTDLLTGLADRAVLTDRLERDAAEGRASSLALLDLDGFKRVNDARGHGVGDDLLVAVARRLSDAVRSDELVARLGGDEFAVVSGRPPDELAAWLLERLREPTTVEGLRASASVGVTVVGAGERGADALRHADIAMYAAKAAGGGRAVTFQPEMSAELLARLALREQLAEGVAAEELVAWLQPVVDLRTHRLVGFEALARWQRPGRPPLPPGDWLTAAEETGLVVAVDDQVLRAAARTMVAWSATVPGAATLTLAVNASGRSLQEEDVAERVLLALADEGLDPHRLVLEVTESVLVDETAGARLQRLREAGVRIALDDFGTGWSSLSYLRRFPVDVLKLDRSFVAGVADGEAGRAVPAAVLQLAGALRLDVVAEGVETPEQAEALQTLGCRTVQGYLFARPAPAEELLELVRRGKVPGGTPVAAVPDRVTAQFSAVVTQSSKP